MFLLMVLFHILKTELINFPLGGPWDKNPVHKTPPLAVTSGTLLVRQENTVL